MNNTRVANSLRVTCVVQLNKEKRNPKACEGKRGISILPVTGKSHAKVLINHEIYSTKKNTRGSLWLQREKRLSRSGFF